MSAAVLSSPFVLALRSDLDRAAPGVQQHLAMASGVARYRGSIRRRWRRGPLGWLFGKLLHLGSSREAEGGDVELINSLTEDAEGISMLWHRILHGGGAPVHSYGRMFWDERAGVLVDCLGKSGRVRVALAPRVHQGAVVMTSLAQWLLVGGLRLALPLALVGTAETIEWQEGNDGPIVLRLSVRHPLFGDCAGYEALLEAVSP